MESWERKTKQSQKGTEIPLPTDWKRARAKKNKIKLGPKQNDFGARLLLLLLPFFFQVPFYYYYDYFLLSFFEGEGKRKKNNHFQFFYPSNVGEATGSSFLFHFKPPTISFLSTHDRYTTSRRAAAAATFFCLPFFFLFV